MNGERWVIHPDYDIHVSDRGRFLNKKQKELAVTPRLDHHVISGYSKSQRKRMTLTAAIVMLEAFGIEKPNPKARIGYHDGNPANLRLENIFWGRAVLLPW